jgi:hypothetical protein
MVFEIDAKGGNMKLSSCYFRKDDRSILVQGTTHLNDQNIYLFFQAMEKYCSQNGYLIVREGVEIDKPPKKENGQIDLPFEVIEIACALNKMFYKFKNEGEQSKSFSEYYDLPVVENHVVIDVRVSEYAYKLYEAGMRLDFEAWDFIFSNSASRSWEELKLHFDKTAPNSIKEKKELAGSWDHLLKNVMENFEFVRIKEEPLVWRETHIINRVQEKMKELGKKKALMFYGNHHVVGFRNLLMNECWTEVYSRNLKPRQFS